MENFSSLALILAGALCMLLIVLAFAGPSAKKKLERRLDGIRLRHSDSLAVKAEAEIKKARERDKRHTGIGADRGNQAKLKMLLKKTGKDWTPRNFLLICGGVFIVMTLLLWLKFGSLLPALLLAMLLATLPPWMVINHYIKKRIKDFNAKFPDAIELSVRGLRSGLPISETLGIVAAEIPGPVGEEFKLITERMKIGRTMEDAMNETAVRLNIPEFNFFCITLAIQRETGGNLAETLANLATVLRQRAQMKLKIKALSSESKASAYIVGALPFVVFGLVWMMNPEYLGGFFIDPRLMIAGVGGLLWMGLGVFIMYKMVNFEI